MNNDEHLLDILVQYYLDMHTDFGYYITWNSYLVYKGYTLEACVLMLKTDDQLKKILNKAYEKAQAVENSKLSRILK